jgi:multidrug efflux pump subunit AcrA (membrane-fusion protein)
VVFRQRQFGYVFLILLSAVPLFAQGIRERIRAATPGTKVSEAQAADLTLTLGTAAMRSIQQVVRTGGTIDKSHKVITATITTPEGRLVQIGQRVRSFPPESKSSMYQARVSRVSTREGRTIVEATLASQGVEGRVNYVVEIVVERGVFLCIPSEAIIEEGDHRIVYVPRKDGTYGPRKIETGFQGELYTQILGGLEDGDQVVTFGSFFIDSEHKLKHASPDPGQ